MAIQPIDLQTLLMRLGQVGKEEAAQRQAAVQSQVVTGSEIARRSAEQERAVNQSQTLEDGPEQVGDEESGRQGSGSEEQKEGEGEGYREKDNVFRDPDLGQNIDITG